MQPGVDGKLEILGAGDDGGYLETRMRVGHHVHDRGVGFELENHQQVLH